MRLCLTFENFELDLLQWILYDRGRRLRATNYSIRLILFLAQHQGKVLTYKEIHEAVSGRPYERADTENEGNSVRVEVSRLRTLLKDFKRELVENRSGVGYIFHGQIQIIADDLPIGSIFRREGRVLSEPPELELHRNQDRDSLWLAP